MIELFSRKQEIFDNEILSALTPIIFDESDNISSLSAILLDDDYYSILKNGKEIINDISLLKPLYLIAFKAKAFIDLFNKKQLGEHVDSHQINKHKYDIFRLAQLLTENEEIVENKTVKKDVEAFFKIVDNENIDMKQLGIHASYEEISNVIKRIFKLL